MDPQKCFAELLEMIDVVRHAKAGGHLTNLLIDFDEHMENLWEWLEKGGYPPIVDSLGVAAYSLGTGYYSRQQILNRDNTLAIQVINVGQRGWFEMIKYTANGQRIKSHKFN